MPTPPNFSRIIEAMSGPRDQNALSPLELLATLQYRPWLLLALMVGGGCASGAYLATNSLAMRLFPGALPFLLCCLVIFCTGLLAKWRSLWARPGVLSVALAILFALSALYSFQRALPAQNDIAGLVRGGAVPFGPQTRLKIQLMGQVAAPPRLSDFGVEFPLEVSQGRPLGSTNRPLNGRVWIEAPRSVAINSGDEVEVETALADLPRIGNPGERSRRTPFLLQRCWAQARLKEAGNLKIRKRAPTTTLDARLQTLRIGITERYATSFADYAYSYPHATAELLSAMVFGTGGLSEPLPYQTRETFRDAGILHVLVASGSQVALLAGLLLIGVRGIFRRGPILLLLLIPPLVTYALLTGGGASIWRAVVVGLCVSMALLIGRDSDGLSLWSCAFVVLLLQDPLFIHDIGFQLSFAAAWGLIIIGPLLQSTTEERIGSSPVLGLFLLSVSAQIATLPLLFYHFGNINLAGLVSNMVAVPVAGLLIATGMLGLLIPLINPLNYALLGLVQNTVNFSATLPGAQHNTLPGSLSLTLFFYGVIALLLFSRFDFPLLGANLRAVAGDTLRRLKSRNYGLGNLRHWLAFVGVALALVISIRLFGGARGPVQVTCLDVGQGESCVIEGPNGAVLIDGGTSFNEGRGDVGRGVIVPYLQSRGISRLRAIILTHPDADHCNGLLQVLREIPVDEFLDGGAAALQNAPVEVQVAATDYQRLLSECNQRNILQTVPRPGQSLNLGDGATLTVLAPNGPALGSENDNGTVVRLAHKNVSMLFTADIEDLGEQRLLAQNDVRCTVLKLAHHGSASSTSEAFLRAAAPTYTVLSCGRYNSYGHPSPLVLGRLASHRVQVFRTDRDGAVTFVSDGRTFQPVTNRK
jgi:competence protein ComEC